MHEDSGLENEKEHTDRQQDAGDTKVMRSLIHLTHLWSRCPGSQEDLILLGFGKNLVLGKVPANLSVT